MRQIRKFRLLLFTFLIICPSVFAGWSDGWWSSSESSDSSDSESDQSSSLDSEISENIDSASNSEFEEPIRNVLHSYISLLGISTDKFYTEWPIPNVPLYSCILKTIEASMMALGNLPIKENNSINIWLITGSIGSPEWLLHGCTRSLHFDTLLKGYFYQRGKPASVELIFSKTFQWTRFETLEHDRLWRSLSFSGRWMLEMHDARS